MTKNSFYESHMYQSGRIEMGKRKEQHGHRKYTWLLNEKNVPLPGNEN